MVLAFHNVIHAPTRVCNSAQSDEALSPISVLRSQAGHARSGKTDCVPVKELGGRRAGGGGIPLSRMHMPEYGLPLPR